MSRPARSNSPCRCRMGGRYAYNFAALSPDGRLLAGRGPKSDEVKLWDATDGKAIRWGATKFASIAFSPDSRRLAVIGQERSFLWEIARNEEVGQLPGSDWESAAAVFAPNGETVAMSKRDGSVLICGSAGAQQRSIVHSGPISAMTFVAGGRLLAVGTGPRVVLLDSSSCRTVRELAAGSGLIQSLSLSPDGKLLAAGHDDGSLVLWQTGSWEPLRRLRWQPHGISRLTFTP